jgi:hypothetical protein
MDSFYCLSCLHLLFTPHIDLRFPAQSRCSSSLFREDSTNPHLCLHSLLFTVQHRATNSRRQIFSTHLSSLPFFLWGKGDLAGEPPFPKYLPPRPPRDLPCTGITSIRFVDQVFDLICPAQSSLMVQGLDIALTCPDVTSLTQGSFLLGLSIVLHFEEWGQT